MFKCAKVYNHFKLLKVRFKCLTVFIGGALLSLWGCNYGFRYGQQCAFECDLLDC